MWQDALASFAATTRFPTAMDAATTHTVARHLCRLATSSATVHGYHTSLPFPAGTTAAMSAALSSSTASTSPLPSTSSSVPSSAAQAAARAAVALAATPAAASFLPRQAWSDLVRAGAAGCPASAAAMAACIVDARNAAAVTPATAGASSSVSPEVAAALMTAAARTAVLAANGAVRGNRIGGGMIAAPPGGVRARSAVTRRHALSLAAALRGDAPATETTTVMVSRTPAIDAGITSAAVPSSSPPLATGRFRPGPTYHAALARCLVAGTIEELGKQPTSSRQKRQKQRARLLRLAAEDTEHGASSSSWAGVTATLPPAYQRWVRLVERLPATQRTEKNGRTRGERKGKPRGKEGTQGDPSADGGGSEHGEEVSPTELMAAFAALPERRPLVSAAVLASGTAGGWAAAALVLASDGGILKRARGGGKAGTGSPPHTVTLATPVAAAVTAIMDAATNRHSDGKCTDEPPDATHVRAAILRPVAAALLRCPTHWMEGLRLFGLGMGLPEAAPADAYDHAAATSSNPATAPPMSAAMTATTAAAPLPHAELRYIQRRIADGPAIATTLARHWAQAQTVTLAANRAGAGTASSSSSAVPIAPRPPRTRATDVAAALGLLHAAGRWEDAVAAVTLPLQMGLARRESEAAAMAAAAAAATTVMRRQTHNNHGRSRAVPVRPVTTEKRRPSPALRRALARALPTMAAAGKTEELIKLASLATATATPPSPGQGHAAATIRLPTPVWRRVVAAYTKAGDSRSVALVAPYIGGTGNGLSSCVG